MKNLLDKDSIRQFIQNELSIGTKPEHLQKEFLLTLKDFKKLQEKFRAGEVSMEEFQTRLNRMYWYPILPKV